MKREQPVVTFEPKAECTASENLAGFIDLCRNKLFPFGKVEWESNRWDVTLFIPTRGPKIKRSFIFSKLRTGRGDKRTSMAQPFLDFAKALMVYDHIWLGRNTYANRLAALRALEKALVEKSKDGAPRVEATDRHVLDRAVELLKQGRGTYYVAILLTGIAIFLVKNRLVTTPFEWRRRINKPESLSSMLGRKADEWRRKRLPSLVAVEKLGQAFRDATDAIDIVGTAIPALLLCFPSRISEVFCLPMDCEVEMGEENEGYGIRWWPAKGGHPMVKWLATEMVDVAKKAIEKLRMHTGEARKIALWYEKHPGQLYLAKGLEHLRQKQFLRDRDIKAIMGFEFRDSGRRWAANNGCVRTEKGFLFRDLEKAVVAMLPAGFPIFDEKTSLKYSKALLVVQKNFFNTMRPTLKCMIEAISNSHVNTQIGGGSARNRERKGVSGRSSSVFTRLGLRNDDGSDIAMTSLQFRQLLNTMAQRKNLSQVIIALWSGRKDFRQNQNYDQRTPAEKAQLVREVMANPRADEVKPKKPVTRAQFKAAKYTTTHVTEHGYCVHDYLLLPCQRQRNCLECTEHRCIKGDKAKTERVRFCLHEAEEQLARDEQACAEGTIGADVYLRQNRRRVNELRELVAILDDPNVPEGSEIVFSGEEYSPIIKAIDQRIALGDKDAKILAAVRARNATLPGPLYLVK